MQRHAEVPIHAIPGNHDLYGPGTVWTTPQLAHIDHLHIHPSDDEVELADDVTLWSLPVRSKHDIDPQEERLPNVQERAGVHVVMAHGHDTAYLDLQHEDCKLPIHSGRVLEKGYGLLILGHWHSWNEISPRVLYPGTHEQTSFAERDAGHVALIDVPLDGSAPIFHRMSLGQLRWREEVLDLTEVDLPDGVVDAARTWSKNTDFLKLNLTGDVKLNDRLDALPRAQQAIAPMFTQLTWSDETRELIDVAEAMSRFELPQGLRQVQEALLQELQNTVDDRLRSDALQAELEALYEVARDTGVVGGEVAR